MQGVEVVNCTGIMDTQNSLDGAGNPAGSAGSINEADSVEHSHSPGRETVISHGSRSALEIAAGNLWMKGGFIRKKWIDVLSRIEEGRLFVGEKS